MKTQPTPLACLLTILLACFSASHLTAQSHISHPWEAGNQKAQVTQWVGLVEITITYFSPDVTGPNGEDRKGKIWGDLVPYNNGDPYPWRAGANHNTTISFTHDVSVQGQPIAAGTYGLHMVPGPEEWIIIFSNNSTSWGSFTYDPTEDALRMKVKPQASEFHEWLTYEFVDRQPDFTVAALQWENLQIPFKIAADVKQLFLEQIRNELRDEAGFTWQSWHEAAKYCLENEINYEEGLAWVNRSIEGDYFSQKTSANLQTKAKLLEKLGRKEESAKVLKEALGLGTPDELYQYARSLMRENRNKEALEVFKLSHKKHKDAWPVHLGLGRGYRSIGDKKNAMKYFKSALKDAPNERQRLSIGKMIQELEANK